METIAYYYIQKLNEDSSFVLLSVPLSYFILYLSGQISFLVYFNLQIIFINLNYYLCIVEFACLIHKIDSLILMNLECLSQIHRCGARVHQVKHHSRLEILGFRGLHHLHCRLYCFGKKLHIFQILFSKHCQKSNYFKHHYCHLIFAFSLVNLYYFFVNTNLKALI